MSRTSTSIKEASTKRTMTISKKPRGLKRKLDYDDEEEKDTTDEDQQTMEIN